MIKNQVLLFLLIAMTTPLMAKTWYLPSSESFYFHHKVKIQNYSNEANIVELYIRRFGGNLEVKNITLKPKEDLFLELKDWIDPRDAISIAYR